MSATRGPADVWASGNDYHAYVGRWSRLVSRDFLRWLSVASGSRWLDVGCGTGTLCRVILEQEAPQSVRGVDSSAGFIDYARANIEDDRATFTVGDAQALPVNDAEFDAAVSGLMLNFVPDTGLALQEMARATRPGGAPRRCSQLATAPKHGKSSAAFCGLVAGRLCRTPVSM